jgi:hypothetical protein
MKVGDQDFVAYARDGLRRAWQAVASTCEAKQYHCARTPFVG